MKIETREYKWNGTLGKRSETKLIVIHHRAGNGDVESIHKLHLERGFSGIGYHFYVRKDGSVQKGRPIDAVGAHAVGANQTSVGVCFEGNFEEEKDMPIKQLQSGRKLVEYLKNLYPKAVIKGHREVQSTACPGRFFPIEKLKEETDDMSVEEAVEIIQAKTGIEDETIEFLLCYKYGEELVTKIAEALR